MKNILVCGGLGYIGSHVVVELLQDNNVIIIDDLSNSYFDVLDHIKKITQKEPIFYNTNVNQCEFVFQNHPIDAIIYLAGSKSVIESIDDPLLYYDNNVSNLITILKWMQQYHVKNIIFSSSAAVYGDPEHLPLTETSLLCPSNPYGHSKLMCEQILKDLSTVSVVILRYFNPVGSHSSGLLGDHPKKSYKNLFPILFDCYKYDKIVNIYGNSIRDYIHVVDLAQGHVKALNDINNIKYEVFNLGSGCGYSVLDVIKGFEENDKKINYVFKDKRSGEPQALYTNNDKAQQYLEWLPLRCLNDMIKDAIRFDDYINN